MYDGYAKGGMLLFLAVVGWWDAHTRHIPDRLLLFGILPALLLAGNMPPMGLPERMAGMAGISSLLLCLTLLCHGAFGGGDVKLMALTGFVLGWESSLRAFAVGVLLAGIYVLWKLFRREIHLNSQIPFGPFLCVGIMGELLFL